MVQGIFLPYIRQKQNMLVEHGCIRSGMHCLGVNMFARYTIKSVFKHIDFIK